jgi:hypothetical protein
MSALNYSHNVCAKPVRLKDHAGILVRILIILYSRVSKGSLGTKEMVPGTLVDPAQLSLLSVQVRQEAPYARKHTFLKSLIISLTFVLLSSYTGGGEEKR